MRTDGIILDTAYTLSDNPQTIDKIRVEDTDKIIYICGHGNLEKQTIGGRSMQEIAKMLVDGGYKGIQDIYVTSCNSNTEHNKKTRKGIVKGTIVEDLSKAIETRLIAKNINLGNENYVCPEIVVESDADGSSIVTESKSGEIEIYILKSKSFKDRLYLNLRTYQQNKYLKTINADKLELDINNYNASISERIHIYKNNLVHSEMGKLNKVSSVNWVSLLFYIAVISSVFSILMLLNLSLNYTLLARVSILVIGLVEIFKTVILQKCNWDRIDLIVLLMFIRGLSSSIIIYTLFTT